MDNKRKIQEVNAGSMADIAFLLLIFFLVATTMNVDTGLQRVLPAMPDPNMKQDQLIKDRNLLRVGITQNNYIGVNDKWITIGQLKDRAKEFVLNVADDENLPEKKMTEIKLPDGQTWNYPMSLGVISLKSDRGTNYETYIMVQNELTRAFNEIRDEVAQAKFGMKFQELNEDERQAVADAVPMKISEAEPVDVGGKK